MDKEKLLETLKSRFLKHMHRHPNYTFDDAISKVDDEKLTSILKMEALEGEPDFVEIDEGLYVIDMYKETPKARANLCYDQEARLKRKKFPPASSALEKVSELKTSLLSPALYHAIQKIEPLDLKTSAWLLTPHSIREKGGALFGDSRYDHVFIYHNGADSYYSVRGFRSYIKVA